MASKLVILLAACVVLAVAQEDCTCEDEKTAKEATDIFTFLNRLNADAQLAEGGRLPTLPALLSPLVPCGNCVENNRKKRKVFPEPGASEEHFKREEHAPEHEAAYPAHADTRNRCPLGFVRISFLCVNAALL